MIISITSPAWRCIGLHLLLLLLLLQLLPQSTAAPSPLPPPLTLTLSPDGSSYSIALGFSSSSSSSIVLTSPCSAFAVRYNNSSHSSCDATLKPDAPPTPLSGSDGIGSFTGYSIPFNGGVFVASFRIYPEANWCGL